jgi:hypothetical protein
VVTGETLKISGRYLYVRSSGTTVTARGDGITSFTINAPSATALKVNGTNATFKRNGTYITYPGSGVAINDLTPEQRMALAASFTVSPDPCKTAAMVNFTLPQIGPVTVQIFDRTGQAVATLADRNLAAGEHQLAWNTAGQAPGIYYCAVTVGNVRTIRELLLIQ